MKQALIVADLLHSRNRVFGLAKYLREFGWNLTILAPEGQQCEYAEVIETLGYHSPYGKRRVTSPKLQWIRPFFKWLYKPIKEFTCYPDAQTKWVPLALATADKLFQTQRFDAVISTSSPVTCHFIAKAIKQKHGVPWIADFRDPWTHNPYYPYSPLRRWRERKLEQETLQTADTLVTITNSFANQLGELHSRKDVHVILNSYDPDEYDFDLPLTPQFTITYTGQIYEKKELSKFLEGLTKFLARHTHLRYDGNLDVRFFGPINPSLLPSGINYHGVVSRKEILIKQKETQVLLLFKWQKNRYGIAGKFFEYLGAKRPILAVGENHDLISDLLDETQAGADAHSSDAVAHALDGCYNQMCTTGNVAYRGNDKVINFSAGEMARKYAAILEEVS